MTEVRIDARVLQRAREVVGAARHLVSNIQLATQLERAEAPYQLELINTLAGAVSRQLFDLEPMFANAPLELVRPPPAPTSPASEVRAAGEVISTLLGGNAKAVALEPVQATRHQVCRAPGCTVDATWCLTALSGELTFACSEHIARAAGEVVQRGAPR